MEADESPTKDEIISMDSPFTSTSTTEINHHIADGVVDSGVDSSESTTTPPSPDDGVNKESSDMSTKASEEQPKVDSDVMETAEMLLSLSGSNNLPSKPTSMNGGIKINDHKAGSSGRVGLKDEFIKSLSLQKKESIKDTPIRYANQPEGSKGRD